MRKAALDMVGELARRDPRVVFLGSDLSPGLLDEMRREFPDRWFMEGVSEQNLIGVAAGLAMDGYIPFVNTIATFLTRRCFDQLAVDACMHGLPIRLIASGGGLVYAPLGPTHLAVEDLAIMRALPGMTVVAPCDADEMRRLMPQTLDWPHPMYIRLAKGGDPVISRPERGFRIGKAILVREAAAGSVLFVGTGVMTTRALAAAELLAKDGIEARVLHVHTVKPLDSAAVAELAAAARLVVTVEEHTLVGGLGSAVVECLADRGVLVPVKRLGIPDAFAPHYGGQDDLLRTYGLQPEQLAATVTRALA
jgi:transketolase